MAWELTLVFKWNRLQDQTSGFSFVVARFRRCFVFCRIISLVLYSLSQLLSIVMCNWQAGIRCNNDDVIANYISYDIFKVYLGMTSHWYCEHTALWLGSCPQLTKWVNDSLFIGASAASNRHMIVFIHNCCVIKYKRLQFITKKKTANWIILRYMTSYISLYI